MSTFLQAGTRSYLRFVDGVIHIEIVDPGESYGVKCKKGGAPLLLQSLNYSLLLAVESLHRICQQNYYSNNIDNT
jgi:hypothetical protein